MLIRVLSNVFRQNGKGQLMSKQNEPQTNVMSDEDFEALQQDISALYKQQELERPSAAIDAAILLQAKAVKPAVTQITSTTADPSSKIRSTATVVQLSFWKKHRLPLSSAASVMIIASIMLLNPEFNRHAVTELDDSIPVLSESASPAMMRSTTPQAEPVALSNQASIDATAVDETMDVTVENAVSNSQQQSVIKPMSSQSKVQAFDAQIPQGQTSTVVQGDIEPSTTVNAEPRSVKVQANDAFSNKSTHSMSAPVMQHDSVEKAIVKLSDLVNAKDYAQAERYMQTIEQRFPDIVNPQHPQHKQFTELKQLLTSQ